MCFRSSCRCAYCSAGKDVIGLAQTGSGKTGAFALPILQVSSCTVLSAWCPHDLRQPKPPRGAVIKPALRTVVQGLLDRPQALFALVLSPTRELAIQIAEQFEALGAGIGVRCAVLVGGIQMMAQAVALGKRPHIIVGTPGRVVDHLSNTKVPGPALISNGSVCQQGAMQWARARRCHQDLGDRLGLTCLPSQSGSHPQAPSLGSNGSGGAAL